MNRIERFIRDNRNEFDDLTPSPKVWNQIEKDIQGKARVVHIFHSSWTRWAAAAILVLILGNGIYFVATRNQTGSEADPVTSTTVASNADPVVDAIDPGYAQMVAQFTALIENKQSEIQSIERDNPELYQKFSGDIRKLDSTYQGLRNKLTANPNKEQLLEAMIGNLQMQIQLLNQQLSIIQKVKQPEKENI